MAYLIDSDSVIGYLDGNYDALLLFERLALDGVSISIITYMEVRQGLLRATNRFQVEQHFATFLRGAPILPLSTAVADRCATLRELLRSQGKRVNSRALDLIIAATAIEHVLTLATRNLADYTDIPGLSL